MSISQSNRQQTIQMSNEGNMHLQFQLKMVKMYTPALGMYILPRLNNSEIWQGLFFPRHGYFKQAKIQFKIDLTDFPNKQPNLFVKTPLYHALIDLATGRVDVQQTMGRAWDDSHGSILYSLLRGFRGIWCDRQKLSCRHSLNPQAGQMFDQDLEEFLRRALKSVDDSLEAFSKNEEGLFKQIGEPQNISILKKHMESIIGTNFSTEQKISAFIRKAFD